MTNEELIQAFPECEKIKREDIAECIIKAMDEEKFCSEATNKVYRKAHELYPTYKGPYDENNAEQNAYREYFYGIYEKGIESPFRSWLEVMEREFIARHGEVHTFDEACQIAADEWMRMIFGAHFQDNGDKSSAGGLAMMLGTALKQDARKDYGDDVVEKARTLMKEFYLADCILEDDEDKDRKYSQPPYCDYGPNTALFNILVKAGVSERDANNICPWKTGITIDKKDNSVVVRGYQTARYL